MAADKQSTQKTDATSPAALDKSKLPKVSEKNKTLSFVAEDNQAKFIKTPIKTSGDDLLKGLDLQRPTALLQVSGGASGMDCLDDEIKARIY